MVGYLEQMFKPKESPYPLIQWLFVNDFYLHGNTTIKSGYWPG
jgi:hypothetical protein